MPDDLHFHDIQHETTRALLADPVAGFGAGWAVGVVSDLSLVFLPFPPRFAFG
jgi:hypothetical protein